MIGAFRNGERVDAWPLDSRAAHYGDGAFTTLRVHEGRVCWWPQHRARLLAACAVLHLAEPDWPALEALLAREAAACGAAVVKVVLVAQACGRGYARTWPSAVEVFVLLHALPAAVPAHYREGVAVAFARQPLAAADERGIKTLARLAQVLAAPAASDREVVSCDRDGFVLAAQSANLFAQFGDVLVTPPVGAGVIAGVTRGTLLQSPPSGFSARVQPMHRDALLHADALILCNAVRGFVPVARLGERGYARRDAAAALMQAFHPALGLPVSHRCA